MAIGRHIAVAVAAGAIASKKETGAAVQDRFKELKRAIAKKSDKIRVADVEADPKADEHRDALAKDLDEHGASKNRDVVTTAKELLGLIKVDEAARDAVDAMIKDVEAALVELADVEVEEEKPKAKTEEKKAEEKAEKKSEEKAKPAVSSDRGSKRLIPPDEPSKTDFERRALPIHKRTDRFFLKAGIVTSYVLIVVFYFVFLRPPANAALERCRNDDPKSCWLVVAGEDSQNDEKKVSLEPLQLLCEHHLDPCGCAGYAYVQAAHAQGVVDCTALKAATDLDPKWPCTCARYNYWRYGKQRTGHCGAPKCESN
ncbi:MAG: hypothetical protein KIT84_19060 [Labilithrix sp.]|nr:hypothetical protein [Labilithrix sp.]MCW5813135.1 hypothetical protein [Labilithrix sp.]